MEVVKIKMALARMSRLIDQSDLLTDARKKQHREILKDANDEVNRIEANPQIEIKLRLEDLEDFLNRGINNQIKTKQK